MKQPHVILVRVCVEHGLMWLYVLSYNGINQFFVFLGRWRSACAGNILAKVNEYP